jgi:myotubularin-related protein 3/4
VFLLMHESISFINVPIMLVESLEIKEIFYLYVYLKNAKTLRLSFGSSEKATLWMQRLSSIIAKSIKLEELFAFTFYSWLTNEKCDESVFNPDIASATENGTRCLFSRNDKTNLVYKEYKRMKFDSNLWRLSDVNKNFE